MEEAFFKVGVSSARFPDRAPAAEPAFHRPSRRRSLAGQVDPVLAAAEEDAQMDDLAHAAEALAGEEPKGKRAAIIREMPCEDCGKVLRQARFPLPPNRVLCPPCRRTWERGRKYEARRLNAGAAVPVAVPDALAAPEHDAPDVAVLLAERATLIQRRRDHLERCVDIQAACQDLYHEFDYRYAEVLAAQDRLADIDDALAP